MTDRMLTDGYKIARLRTNTPEDAEDALQDACVRAITKSAQCKGKLAPWFRAVVRTTALNHHRPDKPKVPYLDIVPAPEREPEPDVSILDILLKSLTAREKVCILGKYIDGTSRKELAKKYNCTEKTITNITNRSIKKMRKTLEEL